MSWLLASMTEGILTRVVGCNFTCEMWERIRVHFASQTRAKVKQLKTQLRTIRKTSLKMNEYLLKVKGNVDSLAAVGSPISENDYIETILDGLPNEYESVVTIVISGIESYTVEEIEALLLAQKSRLERKTQLQLVDNMKSDLTNNLTVNVAQTKNNGG